MSKEKQIGDCKNCNNHDKKQRERLIEILSQPIFPKIGVDPAEVVADYLLNNGVIVPPVKIGQTVYSVEPCISQVFVGEVYEIFQSRYGTVCRSSRKGYYSLAFPAESVGKTVFLTPEEAEKALAERSGHE